MLFITLYLRPQASYHLGPPASEPAIRQQSIFKTYSCYFKAMATSINCPICENLCSSEAASCPKCGHPINKMPTGEKTTEKWIRPLDDKPQPRSMGSVLRGMLWVLFVISCIYGITAIG